MASNEIAAGLWNDEAEAKAGWNDATWGAASLEQYKLYVEITDRVSSRRDSANRFFLTLNTLFIGSASFFYEKGPDMISPVLLIFPLAALLAICFAWWRILMSYRQLSSAKFRVIGEFERRLPASPFWEAEWKHVGQGEQPKLYRPLGDVESIVPAIFAAIYVGASLAIVLG